MVAEFLKSKDRLRIGANAGTYGIDSFFHKKKDFQKAMQEHIPLLKRMALLRIRLLKESEGVCIGYGRHDREIREMSRDERIERYKAFKPTFVTEEEAVEQVKEIFPPVITTAQFERLRAQDTRRGVVWVAYCDDATESGLAKALRAVLQHIPIDTYSTEVIELTRLIGYINDIDTQLLKLSRKERKLPCGAAVAAARAEIAEIGRQIFASLKDEFKRKRELFKNIARDAADDALSLLMMEFDQKGRAILGGRVVTPAFLINTARSYLKVVVAALRKRRDQISGLAAQQRRRADVLAEIQAAERRRDIEAFNAIAAIESKIKFVMSDIATRKAKISELSSFIAHIDLAKGPQLRKRLDEIAISLKRCAERYRTSVRELQTLRDANGRVLQAGVRGNISRAAWGLSKGNTSYAKRCLQNAIALLEARAKNVAEEKLALHDTKESVIAKLTAIAEKLAKRRAQRRWDAADDIRKACDEIKEGDYQSAIDYLEAAKKRLVARWIA